VPYENSDNYNKKFNRKLAEGEELALLRDKREGEQYL